MIKEVVDFVRLQLAGVAGVPDLKKAAEDEVLRIASAQGNAALKARFAAVAPMAKKRLTRDDWFPLPARRTEEGRWHTVISSCLYFLLEDAMSFGGANLPAGVLQAYFLQGVIAAVPVSAAAEAGGEDKLLTLIGGALADLMCPAAP